jgi:hypothetical protein
LAAFLTGLTRYNARSIDALEQHEMAEAVQTTLVGVLALALLLTAQPPFAMADPGQAAPNPIGAATTINQQNWQKYRQFIV